MQTISFYDDEFESMIICGVRGKFTSLRVNRYTLPDGWNKYSIRHSDECDEWFYTLENIVIANHFGDFITKEKIEIEDYIYIEGDYSYI